MSLLSTSMGGGAFSSLGHREPPLGFSKQPELTFLHTGILATASTCEVTLRIPTIYQLKDMMVESLVSSEGFGVA